jgi:hypothetical protein
MTCFFSGLFDVLSSSSSLSETELALDKQSESFPASTASAVDDF